MGFVFSSFFIPAESECIIFVEMNPLEWEQTVWPLCYDGVTYNWTGGCNVNEPGDCIIIDCYTGESKLYRNQSYMINYPQIGK